MLQLEVIWVGGERKGKKVSLGFIDKDRGDHGLNVLREHRCSVVQLSERHIGDRLSW